MPLAGEKGSHWHISVTIFFRDCWFGLFFFLNYKHFWLFDILVTSFSYIFCIIQLQAWIICFHSTFPIHWLFFKLMEKYGLMDNTFEFYLAPWLQRYFWISKDSYSLNLWLKRNISKAKMYNLVFTVKQKQIHS